MRMRVGAEIDGQPFIKQEPFAHTATSIPMTTRSLGNIRGLIKKQPTKMESMSWVPDVRRFAIEILLPAIHPPTQHSQCQCQWQSKARGGRRKHRGEMSRKMESLGWIPYVRRFPILLPPVRQSFTHPHSNTNANDNPKPEEAAESVEGSSPPRWSLWVGFHTSTALPFSYLRSGRLEVMDELG